MLHFVTENGAAAGPGAAPDEPLGELPGWLSELAPDAAPQLNAGERKTLARRLVRRERQRRYGSPSGRAARCSEADCLALEIGRLRDGLSIAETSSGYPPAREQRALTIAAFIATEFEPDPAPAIAALAANGNHVLVPVSGGTAELDWVEVTYRSRRLRSPLRGFGDEPIGERLGPGAIVAADLVVAPGLAVTSTGVRLGQGGGYYDRALARCAAARRSPVFAVLVHPHEVLPPGSLPDEAHDVRADVVISAAARNARD